jgi:hypothetical protein
MKQHPMNFKLFLLTCVKLAIIAVAIYVFLAKETVGAVHGNTITIAGEAPSSDGQAPSIAVVGMDLNFDLFDREIERNPLDGKVSYASTTLELQNESPWNVSVHASEILPNNGSESAAFGVRLEGDTAITYMFNSENKSWEGTDLSQHYGGLLLATLEPGEIQKFGVITQVLASTPEGRKISANFVVSAQKEPGSATCQEETDQADGAREEQERTVASNDDGNQNEGNEESEQASGGNKSPVEEETGLQQEESIKEDEASSDAEQEDEAAPESGEQEPEAGGTDANITELDLVADKASTNTEQEEPETAIAMQEGDAVVTEEEATANAAEDEPEAYSPLRASDEGAEDVGKLTEPTQAAGDADWSGWGDLFAAEAEVVMETNVAD